MVTNKPEKAEVLGVNSNNKAIIFFLSREEIKHIRRCLKYRRFYVPDIANDLTNKVINKFELFGKITERTFSAKKNFKKNHPPTKCALCEEKNHLTVDHIKNMSDGGKDDADNMQWLCAKCHTQKNYDWIIKRKLEEVEKIKELKKELQHRESKEVRYIKNNQYVV